MNSTLSPEAIVGLAKARGQRVVALCDQGNLHGAVALVQAAKEAGIRPVLGAEIQVGGKPLWLFVENARGYANLCRLLSECGGGAERREERGEGRGRRGGSKPDGKGTNIEHRTSNAEHRTPDIEHPLRTPSFAHRASEGRPHFLLRPPGYGGQAALRTAEGLVAVGTDPAWAEYFPGRFYLGVRSAEALRRMPGADQLPCVAIAPVCYAQPRDRWKLEIVQSIRTLTLLRQAHPEKLAGGERHYPLAGEWEKEFKERPDLLRRTQEIAERCAGFELPLGAPQFPAFRPPDGSSPREFLRQLVFAGAQARYGGEHGCDQAWVRPSLNHDQGRVGVPADRTPGEHAAFERKGRPAGPRLRSASHGGQTRALPTNPQPISNLQAQIELELQIIHDVGYEEYFLVVWDILQGCRREGIHWITRGSAADSLVCYCLGISDVCPIRFDLYFRRFLNKERMALHKLPDIDVDFPHDRKDDVIDLVFAKYGAEHCAVVGGFSTFQARSAFAEVAKVLGVAEREVRRFTEHFPWSFGGGWEGQGGSAECGVRSAECGVGAGRAEGRGPNEEATTCNQLTPHSLLRSRSFGGQAALRTSSVALRAMEDRPHSESGLIALLRASPECRDLPLDEEPYRSALIMAECLDGVPRYPKMHPCGVVLSRQPMHELTPTFVSGKGYATTHFDMDAVEAVGLVKIDILAQGGLAVMRDAAAMLQERGVEVDLVQCGVRSAECGVRSAECGVRSAECGMGGLRVAGCGLRVGGTEAIEGRGPRAEGTAACDPRIPNSELRAPSSGLQTPSYDDPLVWDMIASGGARAVHHIESPAMTSLCRMTNVREIDGLIAIVSVIRPGAANEQKKVKFTRRYQGLEAPEYPHPSLEPCLRSTFGLVVYEEHILQMCEAFAGINPGRADVLRRALVKRKWRVVEEIGREFVTAARARGHADLKIREVWELVTGFNGYAFCKAHSTAYGVEAYQSAWLKCYFPAEFMAAVLSNGKGFYRPLVYVLECHRLGIALRPPSVNRPGPQYRVESGEGRGERGDQESGVGSRGLGLRPSALGPSRGAVVIRVPVGQIKGLGERMLERLHGERKRGEFRSLADFYRRVAPLPEEMETLIRAGALDEFGQSRTHQFWEAQWLHRRFGQEKSGQGWLFESAELGVRSAELGVRSAEWGQGGSRVEGREAKETATCNPQPTTRNQILPHSALPTPHLEEPSRKQRLLWETELLGFAASGHPLELFDDVAWETYCPVTQLGEHVGEEVVVCGLIIEDRVHHQATGEPMKFLTLCDWTGMVETELFASTYKAYGLATVRYPVLEIAARVEPFENGRGHTLRVLRAGKPRKRAPGSSAGGRFASGPPGLESAGRPVGPALVGSGMDRPRAGRSSRD